MATLPPVNLGAILFLSFLAVLALRKPIENRFVLSAAKTSQPERQFLMDLGLCLTAGMLAMAFNIAAFGFPIASGIKLMIGCAVAGFFLSLDTALARGCGPENLAVLLDESIQAQLQSISHLAQEGA